MGKSDSSNCEVKLARLFLHSKIAWLFIEKTKQWPFVTLMITSSALLLPCSILTCDVANLQPNYKDWNVMIKFIVVMQVLYIITIIMSCHPQKNNKNSSHLSSVRENRCKFWRCHVFLEIMRVILAGSLKMNVKEHINKNLWLLS